MPLEFNRRGAGVIAPQSAAEPMPPTESRLVVFAVFDGIRALDLTGPLDAFAFANDLAATRGGTPYSLRIVSEHGGPLRTSSGLVIATEPLAALEGARIDTLIVAGGAAALRRGSTPETVEAWLGSHAGLVAWIGAVGAQVRRMCSVCTGTFLLAASGLIAGRSVATHWAAAELLADCFPALSVEPDRIFLQDGAVWSSGGVTSGIDLALGLIEHDLGSEVAVKTARVMVVYAKRPGGQSQFGVPATREFSAHGSFADLHRWMSQHLAEDLRVEQLADQVGMSRRTFMRAYTAAVGRTPGKTLEAMRIEAARAALEDTAKSIKLVARQSGFGDVERMRRAFQRQLGVNPADYRARFSPRAFDPRGDDAPRAESYMN